MKQTEKRIVGDVLEEMLHELRAINAWDRAYASQQEHSFIETSASEARRRRILELLQEFIELKECSSGGCRLDKFWPL
jgi:hypothetical protein